MHAPMGPDRSIDVLGLGCTAVDDLIYVETFPPPDTKARIVRREQQCGGLCGTALVAAARLGSRGAYAGRLGLDAMSRLVEENFSREGIDTAQAPRAAEHGVVHSTIIVGTAAGTRNVFSSVLGLTGAHETLPAEDVIRAARVLFVDHHGVPGAIRAAELARAAGVKIVADFERDDSPRFSELLALVDHPILSEKFARRLTGAAHATDAVRALRTPGREAIVITCGAEGCWFAGEETGWEPHHFPAFSVRAVDTTGCGDVFHGACAAALAAGMALRERVRFASAAAAIKATRPGAQRGAPGRAEVEEFLRSGKCPCSAPF